MENLLNVITTTLNAWSKEVFDNVINQNALLYCFRNMSKLRKLNKQKSMGSIVVVPGGKEIEERVSLVDNANTKWVSYDDSLTTNRNDVLNTALFKWKIVATTAVAYDAELHVNQDSAYRKSNLVEDIVSNAESSLINAVGKALFNSSDTKSIDGLPKLITDDGTTTGGTAVGGIDTSTYPNWKNQFAEIATADVTNGEKLMAAMGSVYRKCRGQTDIIVMPEGMYATYEAYIMKTFGRTTSLKALEDAWFDYLMFHGAVVIYDENCPADHAYFLDTASIKLNFLKGQEFAVGEREKEAGTQKNIWPITAMCNFSVRNRRNLGVLVKGE